jgi:hypothetical protein
MLCDANTGLARWVYDQVARGESVPARNDTPRISGNSGRYRHPIKLVRSRLSPTTKSTTNTPLANTC